MEAMGTLAGGIAHDFNNILGAMIGYTDMTLDDVPEDSIAHQNLEQVLQAGKRARELVQQILAFSRRDADDDIIGAVKLDQIIEEAFSLLRATLPSSIELRKEIGSTDATVKANESKLHQVLMNLCTNARHAIGDQPGMIRIGLEEIEANQDFAALYSDLEPGPYFKIHVRDTGQGMDQETQNRVFEPFFTTKEVGEGTGMGLSVVHGIIKEYDGAISVYSEPGKGTEFTVFLKPFDEDTKDEMERDATCAPATVPTGTGKVMVVDDEPAMADVATQMLTRLGYEVVAMHSGFAALQKLRQSHQDFDLVITDQTMPNITGDQILQEVKSLREDLPVIICSGYSKTMTKEKALDMGASRMVAKPFTAEILGRAVYDVLNGQTSSEE